jgi:hypothetical protein
MRVSRFEEQETAENRIAPKRKKARNQQGSDSDFADTFAGKTAFPAVLVSTSASW